MIYRIEIPAVVVFDVEAGTEEEAIDAARVYRQENVNDPIAHAPDGDVPFAFPIWIATGQLNIVDRYL